MLPFWRFFIEKRQFTLLLMLGLTLWGAFAALNTTKESTPEIQIPIGVVSLVLPGASPEDVERLVTNKVEARLANLPDLSKLTSTSRESLAVIVVEFTSSADLTKSIQKLKDEVDNVLPELPAEAKIPAVSDVNFSDQPIQLVSVSADLPPAQFAELAEALKNEMQTVPGVNRIDVSGVRDREIQVVVRKEELTRLGVSLSQVVSALSSSNASLPIGAIVVDDVSYAIDFRGSLDSVTDIGGVAILNLGGQVIYLRDIADVSDGVKEATSYSRISLNGQPSRQAMTLSVLKVRGHDITAVTAAVEERLLLLQEPGGLLDGSDVVVSYDAAEEIQKNLTELTRTGLQTVALIMLVLLATIGWRESLVAGLSIPLSFFIAFIGLWYSGNTFNIVSLFSLILAIGILIDAGIVMVEAIHTRTRLYAGDKNRAAIESLREYAWPLIGGTMTTVAVFFPLFFISGIVGKFIASIPFTLIFVLIASIFVALGLVPTLANMFSVKEESKLAKKQDEYAERAREWYAKHLKGFLANRRGQNRFLIVMLVGFFVAFALPILGLMKVTFFPGENGDFLYADIELPAGTALNRTDLAARAVEEKLYGDTRFESLVTTVGSQSLFSDSTGMGPQSDSRYANITINLVEDRKETSAEILVDVKAKLADITMAEIRVGEPSGGPPVGAPVLIKYLGKDRGVLNATVTKARVALEKTKGATSVNSSNKFDGTQYVLTIDRGKLAQLGLSPTAIAATLRTAVSGVTATKLTGGDKDVEIVVSLNLNPDFVDPHEANHTTIDTLRQIPLTTQSGTVLLGSVIRESVGQSDAGISHEDRERVVTLTSDVLPGHTPADVLAAFHEQFPTDQLPADVTEVVGGENEETNKSFAEMGYALIAGLALMFVILVLAFDSFRYTLFLLSIVPLSLIGVFVGLTVAFQPLSFPSMMGVIALAGVIINHAIILMDAIIKRMKTGAGRPFADIVTDAAVSRLRPIVLTTVTTVVGMIPLTFASALFGPLALAILFGLTFAMILTLVLIPVLVYRWPGKLPEGIRRE